MIVFQEFPILRNFILLFAIIFASFSFVRAQDSEPVVIDEVVAQINDGVITYSQVKRQLKAAVEALVASGKPQAEAQKEIDDKQYELIANLINEELLLQKGKEIGLEKDVDAQVNQRFVGIMKEQNIKSLDDLYTKMRESNLKPEEIKLNLFNDLMKDSVMQQDVDRKLYFELTSAEIKKYFEAHKDLFKKPESITLSELFLSFAGRTPEAQKAKADDLIAQVKKGADFAKLTVENSDRPDAKTSKGSVGTFAMNELNETVRNAIKGMKKGDVAPIEIDEGITLIHIDEIEGASESAVFNEDKVRLAILRERSPEARKKYLSELRRDAYIKLSDSFRPLVGPILFKDDKVAAAKKN